MMLTQEYGGRQYGQLNGWRYGYWNSLLTKIANGVVEIQVVTWARLIAICETVNGEWKIPTDALKASMLTGSEAPEVEAVIDSIMEEWVGGDIVETGNTFLSAFNNLGLKAQDNVEKN